MALDFTTRAARSAASHPCSDPLVVVSLVDTWSQTLAMTTVRAFSSALAAGTGLPAWDVKSNSSGSEGARMLVESLKRHPCCMTLALHEYHIGASGAASVAEVWRGISLCHLDLSDSSIEDLGAMSLAKLWATEQLEAEVGRTFHQPSGAEVLSDAPKRAAKL